MLLVSIYMCVRGSVAGKDRNKSIGKSEMHAPFQGLLRNLRPQTHGSDPSFTMGQEGQIWLRLWLGGGVGRKKPQMPN